MYMLDTDKGVTREDNTGSAIIISLISPIREYVGKENLLGSGNLFLEAGHGLVYQTMGTGLFTRQAGKSTNHDAMDPLHMIYKSKPFDVIE